MQSSFPIAHPLVVSTVETQATKDWITSRTLLHSQRVSPIHRTKLTPRQLQSYSTISLSTSTGHHSKWQAPVSRSKQPVTSHGSSSVCVEAWWDAQQKFLLEHVKNIYAEALEKGIAKEQARAILPEGNTVSRLYVNGTIRSWIHYIELRAANGTQQEHMDLAVAVCKAIGNIYPKALEFIPN